MKAVKEINNINMPGEKAKKILIVDDDNEVLKYLVKALERKGYHTESAMNAEDAVIKAKTSLPDLIILDIILPDARGEEVKRILSQDAKTKSIPVIFLTGMITKEEQEVFKKLAYKLQTLAKPLTTEELYDSVRKVLA